ncbi:hypothetical protein [Nitrospirillum sp. BR 11828]|uniref:hypothetical protein n=1 Tax=Nitrospirillum sp. BR 11828 TaxID=3104325 RepID=UPI002ACAADF9|nr:hypothetical protein [Nitrospirillum sp. BR 11828]MDZ5649370.1 hypothetical protein [Nitrospirillum sp. BR 11828]
MELEDRLAVKLLAQAQALLGKAMNETLCTHPDRRLVRALVTDAQAMIAEFGETYFEERAGAPAGDQAASG